ncbi:phage antirepressor [Bifidobacterium crudilactis]|jgi:anti-repressor protein|uniref:phage antirepressor n=2 Tax=Bifidobacterium crudilactis TaxID=327277 RepID=UPI00235794E5|nr:phage antirepressor KilAC domain-containing protein [Bifidobacterium crudilactis]MCI2147949.1 phage antirepressor KilAC domain-containing protein [Bifidobacterium crudilactis]MCI2158683.1 phage antirepressor KilAC domain-containing protein [Bifidobacterium crudilactis]MDN5971854.1 phage antirepressor KilAC domain-containing protein [Bifidobacterium crudilactis]MDN6001127.1 phage antirepressor KilAC domain-containing protein [Bifidobacterium crudilactis]MDN6210299.1 phage antirepressor KilAC
MSQASIQAFEFEGSQFRNISESDVAEIVASDVAKILGYGSAKDMTRTLDDDEKGMREVPTLGGVQKMTVITESGLFKAIMQRELAYVKDPEAKAFVKRFQRWVTHEVLPSIRRHGVFMTEQVIERTLSDPDYLIRLATQLKEQKALIAEQEQVLVSQAPKVLFADAVNASQTSILVGQLAKIIQQNGVPMGQRRLFAWLRERHYLSSRKGEDYNMPLQKYIEQGLFEIKESTHTNPDGVTFTTRTVKVTGKGQQYFVNKFLGDQGIGKAA